MSAHDLGGRARAVGSTAAPCLVGTRHDALLPIGPQISLEKMEQKLRQVTQTSFTMSDAIKTKESETNYKGLAISISDFTDELNGLMKTRF